jgi:uncharacterized protein with HEPN domain
LKFFFLLAKGRAFARTHVEYDSLRPSPQARFVNHPPSRPTGYMHSDPALAALREIAHHIELATGFVDGMSFDAFRNDLRTFYTVTRCLEIVSEASRRLPDDLKARHPAIARREMAGAGNIYRHDYEDVAASFVWATVQNHLPSLRVVITDELSRHEKS